MNDRLQCCQTTTQRATGNMHTILPLPGVQSTVTACLSVPHISGELRDQTSSNVLRMLPAK